MYFELASLCVCLLAQELISILRLLIERMVLIVCINTYNLTRSDKASHVIDMSVSLIRIDSVFYPDYFLCIQIIFEDLL